MSQPGSAVDICNLALDRLGIDAVQNITEPTTKEESVCSRHYDQTRREILRRFIPNFARKGVVLTSSVSAPGLPGFLNGYPLPKDFIRLLTLGDPAFWQQANGPFSYEVSQGYVYSNTADSSLDDPTGMRLGYIFDATSVPLFDPMFVNVLKLQLAANMAYKFTLKQSLITGLLKELEDAILGFTAVAGQERPPRRIQRSRIRDVRRAGGIFRNNTIIGGGP